MLLSFAIKKEEEKRKKKRKKKATNPAPTGILANGLSALTAEPVNHSRLCQCFNCAGSTIVIKASGDILLDFCSETE